MSSTPVSQGGNELTTRRRTLATLLVALALLVNVTPASAVPQSKIAKARAVKAQVDRLDHQVEAAAERYNEASVKHDKLVVQKQKAAAKFTKIKNRMGVVQKHLNTRANSMYREGPMGFAAVLLGAQSFEEFATTWDVLEELNSSDADAVGELKTLRADAKRARNEITKREQESAKQVAIMRANKRSIESQLAQRKQKLRGLEAEIKRLEEAEERARRASWSRSNRSSEGNWRPASTNYGSSIVEIAKSRLGAPYRWGASGPYSFDCSGFTSWVYRQKGISLPRVSRAQIGAGKRVSRGNLEPGDLVFFGSPIHHVGIYVGGGMYIHAPHTGDVVKISSLSRGDYVGACRP